uniref:BLTX742 n=1 Tax=Nephila pilipes TaxID=299642 RepID=A0A076L0C6_NEPPI|nr:BLTX742 [Nephila pilipes]
MGHSVELSYKNCFVHCGG